MDAQVCRSLKNHDKNRADITFQSLNASRARWHSAVHNVIGKKYLLADKHHDYIIKDGVAGKNTTAMM